MTPPKQRQVGAAHPTYSSIVHQEGIGLVHRYAVYTWPIHLKRISNFLLSFEEKLKAEFSYQSLLLVPLCLHYQLHPRPGVQGQDGQIFCEWRAVESAVPRLARSLELFTGTLGLCMTAAEELA